MKTTKDLGNIELSNTVIVSDPSYDRGTWCMTTDLAIRPGTYKAWIVQSDEGEFGTRVASLFLVHEDFAAATLSDWESVNEEIGVDSGQCGIFDDTIYPQKDDKVFEERFYNECCSITLGVVPAGVLESNKGVVTSSGYGDGGYELFAISAAGERVALMLDFKLAKMREIMEAITSR